MNAPVTENAVVDMIRSRGEVGRAKYGVSMDRTDLTLSEWAQHAQEELLDGSQYLERVKNAGKLMERARSIMETLRNERGWEIADQWINDHDRQFGGGKKSLHSIMNENAFQAARTALIRINEPGFRPTPNQEQISSKLGPDPVDTGMGEINQKSNYED